MLRRITSMLSLMLVLPALLLAHSGSHKKVMGTIVRIEVTNIHIRTTDGNDVNVALTSKTSFTKDKRKAEATDARVGMRVVVELSADGTAEAVQLGKIPPTPAATK